MIAGRAVLGALDVDRSRIEVDLLPSQADKLTNPECVPESHQDHQTIANRIAAVTGSGEQLVDLGFRQVFALPVISILRPATTNCRLFRL